LVATADGDLLTTFACHVAGCSSTGSVAVACDALLILSVGELCYGGMLWVQLVMLPVAGGPWHCLLAYMQILN
jgi:hypothetical protein